MGARHERLPPRYVRVIGYTRFATLEYLDGGPEGAATTDRRMHAKIGDQRGARFFPGSAPVTLSSAISTSVT